MSLSFLEHISDIEDPRIAGMTTYPLNEVLLTVFIGMLCKLEDLEDAGLSQEARRGAGVRQQ